MATENLLIEADWTVWTEKECLLQLEVIRLKS